MPTLLTQIVVQGLLSGVLAVIAYGKAVEHLGASKAALFPAIVPAAALIVGVPVTGEIPAPAEWLGAIMATAGLAVAMGVVRFGTKILVYSARRSVGLRSNHSRIGQHSATDIGPNR